MACWPRAPVPCGENAPQHLAALIRNCIPDTMRDDDFEWDDKKARRNVRAHGVTFDIACRAFEDPRLIERLDPDEPDEDRMLLTGLAGDGC